MKNYNTRLNAIEQRLLTDYKVVICYSRDGDERIYSDSACTIPIERETEREYENDDSTRFIHIRLRRPVHSIIDDL